MSFKIPLSLKVIIAFQHEEQIYYLNQLRSETGCTHAAITKVVNELIEHKILRNADKIRLRRRHIGLTGNGKLVWRQIVPIKRYFK